MGLIKEGDEVHPHRHPGIEDFLGDRGLQVAGTDKGITALQMDMKITGLPVNTVADAVNQARPARLHILEKMMETLTPPVGVCHPCSSPTSFRIDPELIGMIGPGGRTIKGIEHLYKIDIEDGGIVRSSRWCCR